MTLIGKMYSYMAQPQTKVILSAAALSDLEIELLPFEYGVTNQSPEISTGKDPCLRKPRWLQADRRNTKETALVDQWVHFAESEIHTDASMIYASASLKLLPGYNADASMPVSFTPHHLTVNLGTFSGAATQMARRPYLSDSITLADLFLATAIQRVGQTICGAAEREQVYPHIFAHYAKVTSDARIKDVFGEPGFIEERLVYN
ncbi:hypothetical protein F5141DRAFT_1060348 [Pisolithus sp. B1]|nr:hypothetical protein F5141DRAFT_1060348 [Pisolithus sp. B1]